MSYLEKFSLDKSSKKYTCPSCGKKRFVVYLNTETKDVVDQYQFGRCDREAECGYHMIPKVEKTKAGAVTTITIFPEESQFKKFNREATNLHKLLEAKLKITPQSLYELGVLEDRSGLTVYVFRNAQGQLINFKWFKYKPDGHRDSDFGSFSLKQPEQKNQYIKEQYSFCLFLEHLLDPEKKKKVFIVESEKTAAICRIIYPEYDWVACGSANGLSDGSEGTPNKTMCLKGREAVWLCDADMAGRGHYNDKSEWVFPSSVRNLIKHVEKVHVLDLFPLRTDGYDLGDAVMDGLRPDLNQKPTWSKGQHAKELHDKRRESLVLVDRESAIREFREGKPVGDTARIEVMQDVFSWMKTFVNCWTGWPNDGKTTFFLFMALVKAISDKWKFCLWSPEMINSRKTAAGIKHSSADIMDELVFMFTGKTPYKHWEARYGIKQMAEAEYLEALDFLEKHFIIIQPKDRKYIDLIDNFMYFNDVYDVDAFLIDPFKNLEQDQDSRTDLYLDKVFVDFSTCAKDTNTSFNIIAHPKNQVEPKNPDGSFKICTQYMLNGGSAWNNNMDGIYSAYRPLRHKEPTNPQMAFYNLKQRKQQLVGRVGKCDDIEFDFKTNRYYFGGVCPVDGSKRAEQPKPMHEKKPVKNPIQFKLDVIEHGYVDTDETPF